MAFSAITGLIGASKQASASKKAARSQIAFARESRDLASEEADELFRYTRGVATRGARESRNLLGTGYQRAIGAARYGFDAQKAHIGNAFNKVLGEGGFGDSPGFKFRRDEMIDAVQGSAAAQGGLYSGATAKALTDRINGLASDEFGRWSGLQLARGNAFAGIAGDRAATMGGLQLGRGNAFARLSGAKADALSQAHANRSNIKIGSGTQANATIGNALAQRAQGVAQAYQTGLNGIRESANNAAALFGAFA